MRKWWVNEWIAQRVTDAGVGVVGTEAKRQAGAAPPRTTGAAAASAAAAANKTPAGFARETAARRDLNNARAQWESKYLPRLEHACAGFDAMTVLVQYLVNEVSSWIPTHNLLNKSYYIK